MSIIFDAMVKAEQEKLPQKSLEQILTNVNQQIADIEFVNKHQKCYDKVNLSVEDMKVLLSNIDY